MKKNNEKVASIKANSKQKIDYLKSEISNNYKGRNASILCEGIFTEDEIYARSCDTNVFLAKFAEIYC